LLSFCIHDINAFKILIINISWKFMRNKRIAASTTHRLNLLPLQ
jgi:hypothetical protein